MHLCIKNQNFYKKILLSVFGNVIKPTIIAAKAVKIMSKSKDIGEMTLKTSNYLERHSSRY